MATNNVERRAVVTSPEASFAPFDPKNDQYGHTITLPGVNGKGAPMNVTLGVAKIEAVLANLEACKAFVAESKKRSQPTTTAAKPSKADAVAVVLASLPEAKRAAATALLTKLLG